MSYDINDNYINPEYRRRQEQRRNRRKLRIRFVEGVKQLGLSPYKGVFFLLYVLVAMGGHVSLYEFAPDFPTIIAPYRALILAVFYWMILGLFAVSIVVGFGIPHRRTRQIEDDLLTVFVKQDKNFWKAPIFKSFRQGYIGLNVYKFHSKYFTIDEWQAAKKSIEKALGVEILGEIKEKGNTIYFKARRYNKKVPKVDDSDPNFS